VFRRSTCNCCGRRFFGSGRTVRRFDNSEALVCGQDCADVEARRVEEARETLRAARSAEHDRWAQSVRAAVAREGWHVLRPGELGDELARVGGWPLGVSVDRWPRNAADRSPALHLCSVPGSWLDRPAEVVSLFLEHEMQDGFATPVGGDLIVVESSTLEGPGNIPADIQEMLEQVEPRALIREAAPDGWDPTQRDQSRRSFLGTEPTTFEGESFRERFEGGAVDVPALGAFRMQLDGSDLPWGPAADVYGEIAGLYVFERGSIIDIYG